MAKKKADRWHFNRQVNLAVVVQLMFLASLIVGSWVNLQRQLYILQHDIARILECQKDLQMKIESLAAKSIEHECELRAIEQKVSVAKIN